MDARLKTMQHILLLHPGAMGESIGRALVDQGHEVAWVGEGRSPATRVRAERAKLHEVSSLAAGVAPADVIVSVCPPAAAADVATSVGRLGFRGIYLDANAVSPDTARRMGSNLTACGATFVDGGIVGPPADQAGTTRLYLSGPGSRSLADLFDGSLVDVRVVGRQPGAASAVKMCFAAWTKGTTALLLAIRALAEAEGVTDNLLDEWAASIPELVERSERVARSGTKGLAVCAGNGRDRGNLRIGRSPGRFPRCRSGDLPTHGGTQGFQPLPNPSAGAPSPSWRAVGRWSSDPRLKNRRVTHLSESQRRWRSSWWHSGSPSLLESIPGQGNGADQSGVLTECGGHQVAVQVCGGRTVARQAFLQVLPHQSK